MEALTCAQSRGAIASLLDWLSKQEDSDLLQIARDKAEDLVQNPYLAYSTAHDLILKTTRDLGPKDYYVVAQEMEDEHRATELDSIFFHISTYTRILTPSKSPRDWQEERKSGTATDRERRTRTRSRSPLRSGRYSKSQCKRSPRKSEYKHHSAYNRKMSSSMAGSSHNSRGISRESLHQDLKPGSSHSSNNSRSRASSHESFYTRKSGAFGFKLQSKKPVWNREKVRSEQAQTFFILMEHMVI